MRFLHCFLLLALIEFSAMAHAGTIPQKDVPADLLKAYDFFLSSNRGNSLEKLNADATDNASLPDELSQLRGVEEHDEESIGGGILNQLDVLLGKEEPEYQVIRVRSRQPEEALGNLFSKTKDKKAKLKLVTKLMELENISQAACQNEFITKFGVKSPFDIPRYERICAELF